MFGQLVAASIIVHADQIVGAAIGEGSDIAIEQDDRDAGLAQPFGDAAVGGLAISLVFGLASSTALTLLVIPAIYVVLRDDRSTKETTHGTDAMA